MRLAPIALLLVVAAGCASGDGNNTSLIAEGQTLRMNVFVPAELAEGAQGTIDVIVGNRGAGAADNVLVDVELPPQLSVVHESHGTGVSLIRDPNRYRYTINTLGVGSDARLSFDVRASFSGAPSTGTIGVAAWQAAIGGDRLERTAAIRMAAK
jgi:hypothetical protein